MKKLFIFLFLFWCSSAHATFVGDLVGNSSTATALAADPADCGAGEFANAINASGTLSCAAPSGSGDVTGVGDCADGACLDGSSDGGTYIRLYDGDSHYLQLGTEDLAGNATIDFGTMTDEKWCQYESTGTIISCDVDPVADTNTNASTICAGTTTYLDGEGGCDDISTVYEAADANIIKSGEIDAFSELDAIVADKALVNKADGAVWLGVHDFGGATSLEIPNAADPTTDAAGEIALDTTITDHQPLLQYYDGGENMTVIAIDTAQLPAEDNEIIKYDAGTDKFVLEADAGGSSANFSWVLQPQQAKLPASNPMAIDAGNSQWRGLFDADTAECAEWETVLQPFSGTLKAKIYYSMASGTANEVEFELSVMCVTDADAADIDTDSFGTADNLSATVPGTAGYLDVLSDASLEGDSCAEGDLMIVKICRDADDADNDDATGDVEFRKGYLYAE